MASFSINHMQHHLKKQPTLKKSLVNSWGHTLLLSPFGASYSPNNNNWIQLEKKYTLDNDHLSPLHVCLRRGSDQLLLFLLQPGGLGQERARTTEDAAHSQPRIRTLGSKVGNVVANQQSNYTFSDQTIDLVCIGVWAHLGPSDVTLQSLNSHWPSPSSWTERGQIFSGLKISVNARYHQPHSLSDWEYIHIKESGYS